MRPLGRNPHTANTGQRRVELTPGQRWSPMGRRGRRDPWLQPEGAPGDGRPGTRFAEEAIRSHAGAAPGPDLVVGSTLATGRHQAADDPAEAECRQEPVARGIAVRG